MSCEEAPPTEQKIIRVPMPTFPPTAMVYSMNNTNNLNEKNGKEADDTVPMEIITKVLTQPESSRKHHRTYICVNCKHDVTYHDREVQVNAGRDCTGSGGVNSSAGLKVHRFRSNSSDTDT